MVSAKATKAPAVKPATVHEAEPQAPAPTSPELRPRPAPKPDPADRPGLQAPAPAPPSVRIEIGKVTIAGRGDSAVKAPRSRRRAPRAHAIGFGGGR